MQQLDIFADSRDRVLLNTLADALVQGDRAAAHDAIATLRSEFPDDRHLGPAALLIDALDCEALAGDSPLADAAAALAVHCHIDTLLHDAARTVLGREAAPHWLTIRWLSLARRARALPFDPTCSEAHAAALCLQGCAWAEAAAAVRGIESWRRKPQPLTWMAQASWHLSGPASAWPLLAELAWLAPQRLQPLLALLPDPRLHKLARKFEDAFDTAPDWAWWPAWLLVEQPLLAEPLDSAQTAAEAAPERGFKLVLSLLRLERQGRHTDIVALRRQLQALQPALFAIYMSTR